MTKRHQTIKPHIKWDDHEWRQLAIELVRIDPSLLGNHDPAPRIPSAVLKQAMAVLGPDRARSIAYNDDFYKGFGIALAALRDILGEDGSVPGQLLLAAPPAASASALAAPPPAPPDDTPDDEHRYRIFWKDEDYLAMARFLRSRYPGQSFLESATATGLELADVVHAMKAVLPRERHRTLRTITPLRPKMIEAFKAAKIAMYKETEQARLAAERATQAAAQEEAAVLARAEAARHAAIAEEDARAQRLSDTTALLAAAKQAAQAAQATQPSALAETDWQMNRQQSPTPVNPYEAAFAPLLRPLVALFAQELVAAVIGAPALAGLLGALAAPKAPAPPSTPAPAPPPVPDQAQDQAPQPEPAATQRPVLHAPVKDQAEPLVARPRKPRIGLFGALPIQSQQVESAFPGIQFVCRSEKTNQDLDNAFNSCDKVIAMVKFVSHSHDGKLARAYGERYTRVNGSSSDVKRQIHQWIRQGLLPAAVAAASPV